MYLKLKHDILLSTFAFKFNLRRYIVAARTLAQGAAASHDFEHLVCGYMRTSTRPTPNTASSSACLDEHSP